MSAPVSSSRLAFAARRPRPAAGAEGPKADAPQAVNGEPVVALANPNGANTERVLRHEPERTPEAGGTSRAA